MRNFTVIQSAFFAGLLGAFVSGPRALGQPFVEVLNSFPGVVYGAVEWGDFDNDDDLDLLISGGTSSNVLTRVYRNDRGGNFTDIKAGLPGVVALGGGSRWADFDGDGDLDVFLMGDAGTPLSDLFRNDGRGVFTRMNAGLAQAYTGAAAWGDFDNDGDLDLFASGQNQFGNLLGGLYRNDGNGVFRPVATSIPSASYGSVCWGDYDRDGDLDLLIGGMTRDGATCRVYRNDGEGQFADLRIQLPPLDNGNATWGDFNNDGHDDILLIGTFSGARVYRNDGNGSFLPLAGSFVEGYDCWAAWGDFDNDGFLDFVAEGARNGQPSFLLAYRYDGTAAFNAVNFSTSGLLAGQVAWADYEGDGHLGFIATGLDNLGKRWTRLFRNVLPNRNIAPTPPGNLSSAVVGGGVDLNWRPGTDAEQTGGLTYNVRVGRSRGAGDVVPSQSSASGYRKIAQFGNVGQNLGWRLTNLTDGVYYWSVQSVDNGFAGSSFAAEQSFSVRRTNNPPVADATATFPLVISVNSSNASVVLDGSRSSDLDGDALQYVWFANGTAVPLATGIVAVAVLPVGTNSITLRVSDGFAQAQQTISVEIITTSEAVNRLILIVTEDVEKQQALVAALSSALRAIDRSNPTVAIHQLENFQNKVRFQVAPLDPALAATLIQDAQEIIDAMNGAPSPARIMAIGRRANGETHVEFSAMNGPIYLIEASTNLVTWEKVGVALTCPDGRFEFNDASGTPGSRFYRVVVVP